MSGTIDGQDATGAVASTTGTLTLTLDGSETEGSNLAFSFVVTDENGNAASAETVVKGTGSASAVQADFTAPASPTDITISHTGSGPKAISGSDVVVTFDTEAGSTVSGTIDGQDATGTVASTTGTLTLTLDGSETEGSNLAFSFVVTDENGNAASAETAVKGTGSASAVQADFTAPASPTDITISHTGSGPKAISGSDVVVTFDTEAGSTVSGTIDGQDATGAVASTTGTLTLTLDGSETEGSNLAFSFVVTDENGNAASAETAVKGTGSASAVQADFTAPEPMISTTVADPTSLDEIPFTVDFGEAMVVDSFAESEVSLSSGTVVGFVANSDNSVFGFNVIEAADGELTVDVAEDVAQDLAGNNNTAAAQYLLTVNRTAPAPVIATTAANPTNLEPIPFTVNFGENMTSGEFAAAEITLSSGTVTDFTPDSANRLFAFNAADADDGEDLTVDVAANVAQDLAGNNNTAADQLSVTVDRTAPTPVITTTAANYTNLEPIPFTVNFGENMTSGEFAAAEITLSSGTVTDFTPDSANRLFAFNAADADDGEDLTVDVAANVATDLAGNNNTAADQLSVTVDRTAPTLQNVTISSNNTNSTLAANGDTVTLSFTASESIADVTATIGNATATVSGSGTSWNATRTLDGTEPQGALPFTINFDDLAGNPGVQVSATTDTVDITVSNVNTPPPQ